MKTLIQSAALLAVVSHSAQADVLNCELRKADSSTTTLIIRQDVRPAEAILMMSYGTVNYKCFKELSFEYECYGHREQPYSTPTQLNITSTKAGSVVVASTVSIPFLQSYAEQGFNFLDFKNRRIAMDTYIVNRCN